MQPFQPTGYNPPLPFRNKDMSFNASFGIHLPHFKMKLFSVALKKQLLLLYHSEPSHIEICNADLGL